MKRLWQLFLTFFKLGAFTFGGGYAMISLIESEVVSKKGWITREEMMDIITIAESTPGPLAVNMATFVGTKIKGFVGALVATLGLIIPPFTIICLITLALNEFKSIALVAYALRGIQAGVVVLIFNAFLKFFKGMDKNIISFVFLAVAFVVALLTDFSVVLLILIGGVVGIGISVLSSYIAKRKTQSIANTENTDTSNGVTLDDVGHNNEDIEVSSSSENETLEDSDDTSCEDNIQDDTCIEQSHAQGSEMQDIIEELPHDVSPKETTSQEVAPIDESSCEKEDEL